MSHAKPFEASEIADMGKFGAFALLMQENFTTCHARWLATVEALRADNDAQRVRIAGLEAALRSGVKFFHDSWRAEGWDTGDMSGQTPYDERDAVDAMLAALSGEPGGESHPSALRAMLDKAIEMARCADVDGWDYTEEAIIESILKGGGK